MAAGNSDVASQRFALSIKEMILRGELEPGERIRQEELASRFGASRQPVRDALRMLEASELIRIVANSGAWVSSLTQAQCIEIYRIREALEPFLLAESTANLTDAQIDELARLTEEMDRPVDPGSFIVLDREFHLLSYAGAPLDRTQAIVEKFWNQTQYYRRAFMHLLPSQRRWIVHFEHRLIVDAIRRRDGAEAGGVLLNHIRRTRVELAKHPTLFLI